jgi:hypothetical protein
VASFTVAVRTRTSSVRASPHTENPRTGLTRTTVPYGRHRPYGTYGRHSRRIRRLARPAQESTSSHFSMGMLNAAAAADAGDACHGHGW